MEALTSSIIIGGAIALVRYLYREDKSETRHLSLKNNSTYYYSLAKQAFKEKDYKHSIEMYTEAISIEENAIYYNDRGCAHGYVNDKENAIADFSKAISIKPEEKQLYLSRGIIHYENNSFQNAKKDWETACELGSAEARYMLRQYFEAQSAWLQSHDSTDHFININRTPKEHAGVIVRNESILPSFYQRVIYRNYSTYIINLN